MCGIAGWLGHMDQAQHVAAGLTEMLRHRGPDQQRHCLWPEAALVHTRLSIIDLSPSGAQPMSNEDGTVWVVLNGEIFNHRELRRGLEQRGHAIRGHSDTAVLAHLYEELGGGCFERLRGMFAIAIYDAAKDMLWLARDRFGIKPLFYTQDPARLSFASELRALRTIPGVDLTPRAQAISDFAALFYVPAPDTFYRGIRAVLPGEVLQARLRSGHLQLAQRLYHRWSIRPDRGLSRADAGERADVLVTSAVAGQMESDVPLGAMLSGGIDSSLVSAAAQALNGNMRTFNVRFPDPRYDETGAAVAVADHIGSCHQTLEMAALPGTWEHVVGILEHAGQPFADTSLFAVQAVCDMMRRNVTVALSGDGGDEGFGGYDSFWRIARIARLQRFPALLHATAIASRPFAQWNLISKRVPDRARDLANEDDTAVIQTLLSGLSEQAHRALCTGLTTAQPVRRLFEPQWALDVPASAGRLERLSAHLTELHFRLTLPNDFLFKVDIASMRQGLEVRVPLLDEDLVSFALTLPHRLKVERGVSKVVLRDTAARRLPRTIAQKPKAGFSIPVDAWVDGPFKTRLRDELLGSTTPLTDLLEPSAYRPWLEAFCAGGEVPGLSRAGVYRRVIMLLALHLGLTARAATPAFSA